MVPASAAGRVARPREPIGVPPPAAGARRPAASAVPGLGCRDAAPGRVESRLGCRPRLPGRGARPRESRLGYRPRPRARPAPRTEPISFSRHARPLRRLRRGRRHASALRGGAARGRGGVDPAVRRLRLPAGPPAAPARRPRHHLRRGLLRLDRWPTASPGTLASASATSATRSSSPASSGESRPQGGFSRSAAPSVSCSRPWSRSPVGTWRASRCRRSGPGTPATGSGPRCTGEPWRRPACRRTPSTTCCRRTCWSTSPTRGGTWKRRGASCGGAGGSGSSRPTARPTCGLCIARRQRARTTSCRCWARRTCRSSPGRSFSACSTAPGSGCCDCGPSGYAGACAPSGWCRAGAAERPWRNARRRCRGTGPPRPRGEGRLRRRGPSRPPASTRRIAAQHRAVRSWPPYFHYRRLVKRLDALPGRLAVGQDFDILVEKR